MMEIIGQAMPAKIFTTSSFCGAGLEPKILSLNIVGDFTISSFAAHELWRPRSGLGTQLNHVQAVSREVLGNAIEISKEILFGSTPVLPLEFEVEGQRPLIIPTSEEKAAILFDVENPKRKPDPHQNIQYFVKKITEKIIVIFLVIASVVVWTKTVNVTEHAWKTSSPHMNAQVANVREIVRGDLGEVSNFVAAEQAQIVRETNLNKLDGLDSPYQGLGN